MWTCYRAVLGALLLVTCGLAQGSVPVLLSEEIDEYPLACRLEQLEDASGRMSLDEVRAAPEWRTLSDMPDAGYTHSAIWLRLTLIQPPGIDTAWRLSIDDSQFEEVQLHTVQADGRWQLQRAGRAVDRAQWPLASRTPTFRLQLPAGQHTIYLRLVSQLTLSHAVQLYSIDGYLRHSNLESLGFGIYFGVFVIAVALQLVFLAVSRDMNSVWYLIYTLVLLAITLLRSGYPQLALGPTNLNQNSLLSLLLIMVPSIVVRLTATWLELQRHLPRFNLYYQSSAYVMCALVAGLQLAGKDFLGLQLIQVLTLLWLLISLGVGCWLWRQRGADAGYYLLVFGVINLAFAVRFARNLGWLPVNFLTDYAIYIGTATHLVLINLYFIHRYNQLRSKLAEERQAREEQRDFVSMVSHEFRTPLAIISTSIQQLAANLHAPPEKSRQRAQNIRSAVQRMNLLLDDYLSQDRLDTAQQALQPKACDVYAVVEDAASDWTPGRIRLNVGELPHRFVCDPDLMRIALRNLLANADRHSPESSVIELDVRVQDKTGLHLRVLDHGVGIAPDEMPRIFQRYFRGRASQGKPGAGLGLHLVQRIVQLHGGSITVQSQEGQGTAFTIFLPSGQLPPA